LTVTKTGHLHFVILTWNTFVSDISHLAWVRHYLYSKFVHY